MEHLLCYQLLLVFSDASILQIYADATTVGKIHKKTQLDHIVQMEMFGGEINATQI